MRAPGNMPIKKKKIIFHFIYLKKRNSRVPLLKSWTVPCRGTMKAVSTIEAIIANRIVPPAIPVIPEMVEVSSAAIVRIIKDVNDSTIFISIPNEMIACRVKG
jgi:hypothetical protein